MAVAAASADADRKNESSSSSKSIIMTTKKNAKKKRRRVSKHILNSSKTRAAGGGASTRSQEDDGRGTNGDGPPVAAAATAKKQQRSKNNKHVKDPKEAMAYLEQWKVSRGLDWKFNKNTQSWLIRHMYDAALVSKHTFEVLLEYLQDCHADVKKRLCIDATQRAVRYQRHAEKNADGDKNRYNDNDTAAVDVRADESFQQRDEHDKRKEYKRARKLLDALQQKQPASSEQSL